MNAWYDELREAHRPVMLRLLLVAESPPDPGDGLRRFFYAPDLSHDNLYRGVAQAMYGTDPAFGIRDKARVLRRLQTDGVWLIDAVDEPVNKWSTSMRRKAIRATAPALAARVAELSPSVGVIICHGVVYEEVSQLIAATGVPVLHREPLPFPLGNWREKFVAGFRQALEGAGW